MAAAGGPPGPHAAEDHLRRDNTCYVYNNNVHAVPIRIYDSIGSILPIAIDEANTISMSLNELKVS